MNQPSESRIKELAAESAHHVADTGAPGSMAHNTRLIAHAIDTAVQEERASWTVWKKANRNGREKARR